MGRLALVLGSAATGPGAERLEATIARHDVEVLRRHRGDSYLPPHRIDHAANMRALAEAGCDRALSVCSVGSLKSELAVGTLLCPDDFIALQVSVSAFDDARGHRPPGFDREWRTRVLTAAEGLAVVDGGVYWQTNGPRFETPAEVGLISAHADVVGMTMASECVVAGELGIAYAALCVVDNLANGVAGQPLGVAELEASREANATRVGAALDAMLPELGS